MDSSWRHSYYKSHKDWSFDGSREHSNNSMYNQQDDKLYQHKYPQEWKNFKLKEFNKMNNRKMDRSAVNPLVKHFLFSINVLFFAAGLSITSLSIYVLVESDEEENDIGCFMDYIFSPACLLCTLGGLVLVPAFLGCYGALRENTIVIKMYFVIAIILLLIEIVLVVLFFTFTLVPDALANIGVYPEDFLDDAILQYGDRVHKEGGCGRDRDDYVDFIQDKFSCCGASNDDEGYLDWLNNPYYNCTDTTSPTSCSVPISCCRADTTTFDCGANTLDPATTDFSGIYIRGCEKGMRQVFEDNIIVIAFCSFGGIILQIFFTCCGIRLNSQVMEQRSKW